MKELYAAIVRVFCEAIDKNAPSEKLSKMVDEAERQIETEREFHMGRQVTEPDKMPDGVGHWSDGQSIEDLARRYPGSAESHIMLHRKLDAINDKLIELLQYFQRLGMTR